MVERYGYAPYFEALAWLQKNRKQEVSTAIGGLMPPGIHVAIVQEYRDGGNYRDVIFRSTDNLLHKERTWGKGMTRYELGTIYKFELIYGGDGTHHIEATGGQYRLVHIASGSSVFAAAQIRDIYTRIKDSRGKIKLVYLKIKWSTKEN